jgi:sugar (pentulose or hexulose) kinase
VLPTITVDIGTTGVKLCLFDADARLVASERQRTPTRTDPWGEIYDLAELDGIVLRFVQRLEPDQRAGVQRVAITGVGESGGLVQPDLALASPMILWHDHRGAEHLARLDASDPSRIYAITGLPVNANYGLSKAVWAWERAGAEAAGAQWLNIAEYVAAVMTGERWSERTLASRTMALDLVRRTWSAEICALFGIGVEVFPALRAASEGSAMTAAYARRAGLSADVVVHVAGHDHMVGAVGADLRPGELLNSTGTTEGLLLLGEAPALDGHAERAKLANGLACAGGDFTLFASIPTGGSAFATLESLLGMPADRLSGLIAELHEKYVAGRLDLGRIPLVLPQFRGSPPPAKNAAARGVVAGVRTDSTREEIVLGCFLGMVLQYRDVLELFRVKPDRVKVIGPASRNPLWLQLKADLLAAPLLVSSFPEVVSRGAQALASEQPGDWETLAPTEVHADARRHAQLGEWCDRIRPQWEYMKDFPW